MINVLSLMSVIGLLGGLLLVLAAPFRIALSPSCIPRLQKQRLEFWMLMASVILGTLGSVSLFTVPYYAGSAVTASLSVTIGSNGDIIAASSTPTSSHEIGRTFFQVNSHPLVLALATVPLAFTLIPYVFAGKRLRPVIEGLCAMLLGGQMFIGMSGYGIIFGPAALAMFLAGTVAITSSSP